MKRKNAKGFTMIEILIIVIIITILVSVAMVSLMSAREKGNNNSAFTSFRSLASPIFMCLGIGLPGASLTDVTPGINICSSPVGNSVWPDFSKYGWSNVLWCDVNHSGASAPSPLAPYANGSVGGSSATGSFCVMAQKDEKSMWCTLLGCFKQGF